MKMQLSKLFPTSSTLVVFFLYIILFSIHAILVTSTQTSSNKYEYNVVTVVLLTEFLKLIISTALYCKDESPITLYKDTIKHRHVLALYLIPAFLYCLYNNLSFENLRSFDPTTYNLLLQFRIFMTAILFQIIFKKQLSGKQWLSLIILTAGCMLKQVNFSETAQVKSDSGKMYGLDLFSISTVFLLVQMGCSCLAGVYNEYLLKNEGASINMFVQNVFMYLDSIFCNLVVLFLNGTIWDAFTSDSLSVIFQFRVLLMMLNNATVGIITSFFLKQLNSIVKTFASALELVLTALLSYFIFDIPIYLNTVLSMVTVLLAMYLYTQNPVKGQEVSVSKRDYRGEEEEELLMDEVISRK